MVLPGAPLTEARCEPGGATAEVGGDAASLTMTQFGSSDGTVGMTDHPWEARQA